MKRLQAFTWLAWILAASPALAQEVRKIEVRATGEATAAADELLLPIEVLTSGGDFAAVKQRNDLLLGQLFELLATHKVQRPVVESTWGTFDFSPTDADRSFGGGKGEVQQPFPKANPPDPFGETKHDGAEANANPPMHFSRRLTARFTGLSQATELLAQLTAMNAVTKSREIRLSQLSVSVKEGETHQARARHAAMQNALKKAQQLAAASNLKLGPAMSIVDESAEGNSRSGRSPAPFPDDPFGQLAPRTENAVYVLFQPAPGPADIPPGQIQFSVTLRVVYEATLPN